MNVLEKILEEIEERRGSYSKYSKSKIGEKSEKEILERITELGYVEEIIRSHMDETISEMEKVEKEKVTSAEIISREIDGKPYYEIKFKKVGEDEYTVGYSSFKLDYVVKWLNDYFEFAGEAKVFCENGGWIPVEERLPEEYERYKGRKVIDVLVTTTKGKVTKVQRQSHNGYWWWGRIYGEPTAWQPLPEPYIKNPK